MIYAEGRDTKNGRPVIITPKYQQGVDIVVMLEGDLPDHCVEVELSKDDALQLLQGIALAMIGGQ